MGVCGQRRPGHADPYLIAVFLVTPEILSDGWPRHWQDMANLGFASSAWQGTCWMIEVWPATPGQPWGWGLEVGSLMVENPSGIAALSRHLEHRQGALRRLSLAQTGMTPRGGPGGGGEGAAGGLALGLLAQPGSPATTTTTRNENSGPGAGRKYRLRLCSDPPRPVWEPWGAGGVRGQWGEWLCSDFQAGGCAR